LAYPERYIFSNEAEILWKALLWRKEPDETKNSPKFYNFQNHNF